MLPVFPYFPSQSSHMAPSNRRAICEIEDQESVSTFSDEDMRTALRNNVKVFHNQLGC